MYEHLSDNDLIDVLTQRSASENSGPQRCRGNLDAALAPRIGAEHDVSMGDMAARLDIANAEPWKRYRPLDSVWHGEEDADLIE